MQESTTPKLKQPFGAGGASDGVSITAHGHTAGEGKLPSEQRGRGRDLEIVLCTVLKFSSKVHSLLNPTDFSFNEKEPVRKVRIMFEQDHFKGKYKRNIYFTGVHAASFYSVGVEGLVLYALRYTEGVGGAGMVS